MNLQQKQLEFLNDTIKYYSVNPQQRRCISGNACKYSPASLSITTSEGCAIGRKLPKELAIKLDKEYSSGVSLIFNILPKDMQELGKMFLVSVQNLHDDSDYWTKNGLSKLGLDHVEKIKRIYKL